MGEEGKNEGIEVEFVEEEGVVEHDPQYYEWSILETGGDISKIKYSKVDKFVDLSPNKKDYIISMWLERLRKISKPYIFAEGILKEKFINDKKQAKLKAFQNQKNKDGVIKKTFLLPRNKIYGLFASTDH